MPHALWPVDPQTIAPFLLAVLLIELTPGPNMAYLAALSASRGRRAGFQCVLGVTLGLAVYMLASVAGVTEIVAASPALYGALRWAGVAFLLFLAWETWRGIAETAPAHVRAGALGAPFWRGFIANILNPKAALFYVTLLPTFIQLGHAPFWAQALILGATHIAVSIGAHTAIVIGAANAGVFLQSASAKPHERLAFALSIAAIAVWLAWQTRAS